MTIIQFPNSDAQPPVSDNSDHAGASSQSRHGAPYELHPVELAWNDLTTFERYCIAILAWCITVPLVCVAVYLINWAVGVIDPAFPGFH